MKYFLHLELDSPGKRLPISPSNMFVVIAGPFTGINSLHDWRRLTLLFDDRLPDGASIELATLAHESIAGFGVQGFWSTTSQNKEPPFFWKAIANTAMNPDGIFGAVSIDNITSRTPLLSRIKAQTDGMQIDRHTRQKNVNQGIELTRKEILSSIRRYPMNATDVTLWHERGKRQAIGTQLWVLLRVGLASSADKPPLISIEVESQESGWERDLPQIYQESNTQESPQRQSTGQTGMPILLESLLRLFEFNANAQREKIQEVADWYVPTPQTTNLVELASHLGVHHEGLSDEQLLESLPQAFDRYLKRGTKESLLGVLRIIYKDFIESNAEGDAANPCRVENIQTQPAEVQSKWKKILDLYEPIKKCRIMVLNDLSCRLGDPNVVLSGSEPRVGSAGENAEPGRQLTGLRHLVGRAILQVSADAFPKDQERDNLRRLVDGLAPRHMRIVIDYVVQPAILGLSTFVGESTVG